MAFKAARCPNCSGELSLDPSVKKGFCMHCGSEIIVEEAIKAMKLDGIASLGNLLQLAQESLDDGNYQDAYRLFDRCYELDPDNSDVLLGRSISKGYTLTVAELGEGEPFKIVAGVKRALEKASDSDKERIQKNAAEQLNNLATMFFSAAAHHYGQSQEYAALSGSEEVHIQTEVPFVSSTVASLYMLEYASQLRPKNKGILQNIINISSTFSSRKAHSKDIVSLDWSEGGVMQEYFTKIAPSAVKTGFNAAHYEPSIVHKRAAQRKADLEQSTEVEDSSGIRLVDAGKIEKPGSCYIATAVYGDYNASEVIILRQYRDNVLSKNTIGKLFIKYYYAVSPKFADRLCMESLGCKMTRFLLNIVVLILKYKHK